jgi:lipopolysaccharide transport system ATP-binding protein
MGSIEVRNLGKAYKRYPSPVGRLGEWLTGGHYCGHTPTWVLRGVTFSVRPGEAVGVVGQNAAGKTTLLNILRGTVLQNEGTVQMEGSVAALDLGLGFHPDFTGRENLFAAGSLLGLAPADVRELLPEIEAFAEIGDYLDQPVRTYSSGMRLRLAFSLATAVRPSVLLIDEALMVGDAYFQQKCIARIRGFREHGTTLMLVSHDAAVIKTLCDRALLLDAGLLTREGPPAQVFEYYNATIAKSAADYEIRQAEELRGEGGSTRSGSGEAVIDRAEIVGEAGAARAFLVGAEVTIQVLGHTEREVSDLTVGIAIHDRLGNEIFGTNTHHLGISFGPMAPGVRFRGEFRLAMNLGVGTYSLTAALHAGISHLERNFDWWDGVRAFQVLPGTEPLFGGSCYIPVSGALETLQ